MSESKKEPILKPGAELTLENTELFRDATYPTSHKLITGKYFLYDSTEKNGRVKIVASKRAVRFKPEIMVVEGFIKKEAIIDQLPKK